MQGVDTKPLYEVGYHLVSTITEEQVGAEVARVRDAIESHGGAVVSEEWPKQTQLAYSITHHEERTRAMHDTSYFGWIRFEMDRQQVIALQEALENIGKILRFLVVHIPHTVTKPRAQKRRMRPMLTKDAQPVKKPAQEEAASTEEIDREIEKLMAE